MHTHRPCLLPLVCTQINFTGSPSKVLRLWLPYAETASEAIFALNMLHTPNRRFVWLEGAGRQEPLPRPPAIGDGTSHGAYHWDQNSTVLTVKMSGGRSLEVRTENAVQVSQTLAMTIDQFFDAQALFIKVRWVAAALIGWG